MGRLYIECVNKRIKTKRIANAVYTALKQIDNLKAELIFVSAEEIHALNSRERGVDKVTDVLSFPSLEDHRGEILHREEHLVELDGKYLFLGSIVVCEDKIREQAKEIGHSEIEERTYLIIHGLLHLFGYDHMTRIDKAEMRGKEKEALEILKEPERKLAEKKAKKEENKKIKAENKKIKKEKKKEQSLKKISLKEEKKAEKAKEKKGENKPKTSGKTTKIPPKTSAKTTAGTSPKSSPEKTAKTQTKKQTKTSPEKKATVHKKRGVTKKTTGKSAKPGPKKSTTKKGKNSK